MKDEFASPGQVEGTYLRALFQIARNEMLQLIRTKRLLVSGILIMISLIGTTIVLPLTLFDFGEPDGIANQNLAFLIFLNLPLIGGYFFLQLLAITLPADSVCSEWQRKTLFLVLSKPVPRTAWVLGKFVGIIGSLLLLVGFVFLLDYTLLIFILQGSPSGAEFGDFLGGLGLLMLGMMAFGAMALFFSTITRTVAGAMIFALAASFLLFPLLGSIGDITYGVDQGNGEAGERSDWKYDWSHYATPGSAMNSAGLVISDGEADVALIGLVPQAAPERTWLAALSSLAYTAAFLGGALAMVKARDFE